MKAGIKLPAIFRGRGRASEGERLREKFPFDPARQTAELSFFQPS